MANLLADPNNWQSWQGLFGGSYIGPPSEYWGAGNSSYYLYSEFSSPVMLEMKLVPSVADGDVVAGQYQPLTIDINSDVPVLGFYTADGTELYTVAPSLGVLTSFSFAAVDGMRIGTALSGSLRYAGESRIFIDSPEPPVVDTCQELGRATRNFVSGYQRDRVFRSNLYAAERRCLVTNFNGAIPAGRAIVSATWQTWDTANCYMAFPVINVSPPSGNGREVQVMVTAQYAGNCRIRVDVTLDNGEVYTAWHVIRVQPAPYFNNPGWVTGPSSLTVSV